jgi:transposase
MREEVLTDQLWERLEPLLPVHPRRFRYPGRKRADDRAALEGIRYVIRTGIGWNRLPTALFGASGATCWRRLTEWHEAGVWQQLHERLLAELWAAGMLDLSAALVDSTICVPSKGEPHRTQPRRPPPTRLQAPPDHRRPRHPTRDHADRRPPQ